MSDEVVYSLLPAPRIKGRAAKAVDFTIDREMDEADVAALTEEETGLPPSNSFVKRITARHHIAARALAEGASLEEVSIRTGMHISTISNLRQSPAFRDLLTYYQRTADAVYSEFQGKLAVLGEMAIDTLADRLETDPDDFTNTQLLNVMTAAADRTGNGPRSTNVNLNGDIGDLMERARQRVAQFRTAKRNEDGSFDA